MDHEGDFPYANWDGLLPDHGDYLDLGDYALTMVVDEDGEAWPVLMELYDEGGPEVSPVTIGADVAIAWAPHENVGTLPADVEHRIWLREDAGRCGGWKRDGGRCRNFVDRAGQRCEWHDYATVVAKGYAGRRLRVLLQLANAQADEARRRSIRLECIELSDTWQAADFAGCKRFWDRNRKLYAVTDS